MKITINGVESSGPYPGPTLGDILDQVMANDSEGSVIARVRVNGRVVSHPSPETRRTAVSGIESLDIEMKGLKEAVAKNLTNAEEYLAKLIPGVAKAADLFRSESEQEANKFFINIIDGIEWFSTVIETVLAAARIRPEDMIIRNESIQTRQSRLTDLTRQILLANQNRDWVLVADLLEYEILPYYQDWAAFFPELKEQSLEAL